MQYTVPAEMTLQDAMRAIFPDSSRRTLQNWLKNGRFYLDGKRALKENTPLIQGQVVSVKEQFKAPKISGLKILYEDRYFVVIDKPVGLLSVPLDEGQNRRHALGLLKEAYGSEEVFAVHRIDRETSGILLFARGKESAERFCALFEKHDIVREYYAIVEGRLNESRGTWRSKLLELPSLDVVESNQGKEAITHFSLLRKSAKYTYLKLQLETGRKHQIRVHCQRAGHPIVGDERYGALQNPLKRLCLHACTLGFKHPFTQKEVKFTSPLPLSFQVLGVKNPSKG